MPEKTRGSKSYDDEALLKAEFEYITQTAFQANEDRARVSSFYLVAVGSLVAAVLSAQLVDQKVDPRLLAAAFCALFLMLTILGTLTTLQLSRLRAAWHESMLAMNQLKDYWVDRSSDRNLRKAFRWDTGSVPPTYKANSISNYQMLEVALLSGLTLTAAVYFFQQAAGGSPAPLELVIAGVIGALGFFLQLALYRLNLGGPHAS